MRQAEVQVTSERIGSVSPRLFGADLEHLGRQIYGGIWDPGRDMPRADVRAALQGLGVSLLRYPGSVNCSQYRWRDGVGPKDQRRRYERTVWTDALAPLLAPEGADAAQFAAQLGPPEPNLFGPDEFLQYCLDVGAEPLLAANLGGGSPPGEGTPEEAAAWVRYCNIDRIAPRTVKWWTVGFEPYGPYELGHCSSGTEYAKRFLEFSEQMRDVDPSIKLAAPGGNPLMDSGLEVADHLQKALEPRLGAWNEELLRTAGDEIDALAFHHAFPGLIGRRLRDDEGDYLQIATGGDALGDEIDHVRRQVDEILGAERRLPLYLDEWGRQADIVEAIDGANHRLCDALYFASCYNRMFERADRVRLATLNFLVNGLGVIQTQGDRHFVTAGYLIALLYRRCHREWSVAVEVSCEQLVVPALADTSRGMKVVRSARMSREAPIVDAAATLDDAGASVFLANRSFDQGVEVVVTGLANGSEAVFRYLTGSSPFAKNTIDAPEQLRFAEADVQVGNTDSVNVLVPPSTAGVLIVGGRSAV